jgi:hypothetical protein
VRQPVLGPAGGRGRVLLDAGLLEAEGLAGQLEEAGGGGIARQLGGVAVARGSVAWTTASRSMSSSPWLAVPGWLRRAATAAWASSSEGPGSPAHWLEDKSMINPPLFDSQNGFPLAQSWDSRVQCAEHVLNSCGEILAVAAVVVLHDSRGNSELRILGQDLLASGGDLGKGIEAVGLQLQAGDRAAVPLRIVGM